MNNTILARVVETEKPKRPRLWLTVWYDHFGKSWEGGRIGESAHEGRGDYSGELFCIPGSDEELTPERIEAAIEAILSGFTAREGIAVGPALRMLVRRLGLESEGA